MFLDLDFTVFDGADLPAEAPGLVLPDVRVGGGFSTEINIINPGDVDADIELQLSGEESEESSRQLLIPSHGVQRLNVAELFGLGDSAETRFFYMTATANPDIACFELVKGPGDLLGLNAVPIDEPVNRILFPQMAVLGGLESRLTLSSRSGGCGHRHNQSAQAGWNSLRPAGSADQSSQPGDPTCRAPQRRSGGYVRVLR